MSKENESLHEENANLSRMAQLMTTSMKESVDTSKKYVNYCVLNRGFTNC